MTESAGPLDQRARQQGDQTDEPFQVMASLVLFGHIPVPARVSLFERSREERVRGALIRAGAGVLLAPLVAVFPPHAAWFLGAVSTGGFFAWRSLNARFVIADLDTACPRCAAPLRVSRGARLQHPHPISCQSCHHEMALSIDPTLLSSERERAP